MEELNTVQFLSFTVNGKHYVTEQMNKLLLQLNSYVAGGVKSE